MRYGVRVLLATSILGSSMALPAVAEERPANAVRGYINHIPPESPEARRARHEEVARRRANLPVLVHRGSSAVATENTLEAYAASMDQGADGCEIDIRRSKDGVLYLYHDDVLGRTLEGSGRIRDLTYYEILTKPLKRTGTAGKETRVPTLAAFLVLARERAMLIHLDVKEPGLQEEIARMLDEADMWDHLVEVNWGNADTLRSHPKVKLLAYKGWWPEGKHAEDPAAIRNFLSNEGTMIFTKDPRAAIKGLDRKPVEPVPLPKSVRAMWTAQGVVATRPAG